MEIRKLKYVTLTRTIPNLAAAGLYTADISLDDSYDLCTGIAFNDVGTGLGADYTIGVQNQIGSVLDAVPADILVVAKEDGSAPNERFLEANFALKGGNKVTVSIQTGAAAAAETDVQVTFRLVRLNKPVSI
jgi:hypothetical protein